MFNLSEIMQGREKWWPDSFDDSTIENIVWQEIANSSSPGDFACYLVHRFLKAQHVDEAQARYDSLQGDGNADPVAYRHAITRIRLLAESGHAGALFHMGKVCALGIALEQDLEAAAEWYQRAVALGDMRAHCNLGWMHQSGLGVAEDKEEAFRLLSIGAEHGVLSAKAAVGMMLLKGEGCRANPAQALHCLEQAFEAGYNNAANCIADAYLGGMGVAQNIQAGHHWLERAAVERNDARSQAILGHYLVTGSHGKQDVAHGLELLQQAISNGYAAACLWLGALYAKGQGVDTDIERARMWYERGVTEGDPGCAHALMQLDGAATPAPGRVH